MLDSTNRPKGMQRRLARKRAQAQSAGQSTSPSANQPNAARPQPETNGRPLRAHAPSAAKRQRRKLAPSQRSADAPRPSRPSAPRSPQSSQPKPRLRLKPTQAGSRAAAASSAPGSAPQSIDSRRVGRTMATAGLVAKTRQLRSAPRDQSRSRPASPLVHLCRLLILGVGVGAIVGTVISVWNPSLRNPAPESQLSDPGRGQPLPNRAGSSVPGTLATVSSVRMGREMTDLMAKVTPLTQNLTDLVPGVFLLDLDNGDYLSFNGSTAFSAASMIKVPILIAFLQDVDAGKIKLDELLSMQQSDIAEGSGEMQYAAAGTQFTALDTATNMIIHSDNTATNMIVRRLGGSETLNQRFQQWGLQQTLLRKPLPDLEGLNTTSPKELVSLMALLNEGKLVSMKSRDRAFDIMRRTVTDTLLPSVVAPGTTVAHKTGDIGSLVGDVGIVDLPSGRRYAVAAVVKRPHNDGRAQDLIRQIAAIVYEQFGGKPTIAPSPVAAPPAQLAPGVNPAQPGMAPGAPGTVVPNTAAPGTVAPGLVAPGLVAPGTAAPGALAPGALPSGTPVAPAVPPVPEAVSPEAIPEAINPDPSGSEEAAPAGLEDEPGAEEAGA